MFRLGQRDKSMGDTRTAAGEHGHPRTGTRGFGDLFAEISKAEPNFGVVGGITRRRIFTTVGLHEENYFLISCNVFTCGLGLSS